MHSERILQGMHQVHSHDLPNQLVVLQSLLQMLHGEEADRLSPDGLEFIRRLQKVTRRTAEMVRFLKEMGKLNAYVSKPEEVSLAMLAREIQVALRQMSPRQPFTFDWRWVVPAIIVDYRTFRQALLEILGCLTGPLQAGCRVHATSDEWENGTTIDFVVESTGPDPDNARDNPLERSAVISPEQRMEIILARELLSVSRATLDLIRSGSAASQFSIHLSHR